jgi:ABC-type bacteriocin/lantibiotic exporter with double-glycine peptidase domain
MKKGPGNTPWRKILWIALIMSLLACTASAGFRPSRSLHLIEDVPFYPQEKFQCGPASLAGVLNYRGIPVSPGDIAGEIYSPSARGTLTLDLAFYAEGKGVRARQYHGSIEDLKKHIDSGNPLIVMVDYGFLVYQINHFMVVVGYDDTHIVVNSGRERYKLLSLKGFLKTWAKTNFWTLELDSPDRAKSDSVNQAVQERRIGCGDGSGS